MYKLYYFSERDDEIIDKEKFKVQFLACFNNSIKFLPDHMPELLHLLIPFTTVKNLPNAPKLEFLHCERTQVENISYFPELIYLDISRTKVGCVPNLLNLRELNISNTSIENLPELPSLEKLVCKNTKIYNLPFYKNLKELEHDFLTLEDYKKQYTVLALTQALHVKKIPEGFPLARLVSEFL